MKLPSHVRGASRGQALVETALILPLFLILVLGILDMSRAVWATTSLNSAAREAARFAIVHGNLAACPVGTSAGNVPALSASCPNPAPSKQSIIDAAVSAAIAGGSNVAVTVCYGAGCSGNTDAVGGTNARGQPVTVVITSRVDLIVPSLLGRSGFDLSGSSTMVVNH
jgi:Flp pilus assembly protein TadG